MSGQVVVTRHAVQRARERVPVFRLLPDAAVRELVRDEVVFCELTDRIAAAKPAFLGGGRRRNHPGRGRRRYAFLPVQGRAYVVRRHERYLVVVTTEVAA